LKDLTTPIITHLIGMTKRRLAMLYMGLSILMISLISCDPTSSEKLNGRSPEYLINKFGEPEFTNEFILSSSVYEYQYGLFKFYPDPDGKDIRIREISWKRLFKRTTVWFGIKKGKWVSIDNVSWNPKIVKF
jgi:hypothetical protein